MDFICKYIFYPWNYNNFDIAMNNVSASVVLLLVAPMTIYVLITKIRKLTTREANDLGYYLNIFLICSIFFTFYWYVACTLSILFCYFINWFSKYDFAYMEKEELNGITTFTRGEREIQKLEWEKKSDYERWLYQERCKKKHKRDPNLKLIFTLSFICPVIMIVILELFGFRYRF